MSEEQVPLPWNPDEACKLDNKTVQTRLDTNPEEEIQGTLFNRDYSKVDNCDGPDTTIPRRKDQFIDCVDLPDVPKAKLLKEDYDIVPFPGMPEIELPKRLMAHLLSCCLKDRTAGFDFEIVQALDDNDHKESMDNVAAATTTVSIQLGTYGYILLGLDIKPILCFCDEDCGDEDYIHIKVNMDAEYHEQDWDIQHTEDPDLEITDTQLSNLISNYGGGGGGNPLCAQKLFGVYVDNGNFMPYGNSSPTVNDLVHAQLAPYLTDLQLVHNGIYKLEYFCEYSGWYVTDGQCANVATQYSYPSYMVIKAEGLPNQTFSGTIIFFESSLVYPYDQISRTYDSTDSSLTVAEAFVDGITFNQLDQNSVRRYSYSFQLNEGVEGTVVYNIILSHSQGSCDSKAYKLIFQLKATAEEEEEEE